MSKHLIGSWLAAGVVAGGFLGLHIGDARAHIASGAASSGKCSPHDQTGSTSGSSFNGCNYTLYRGSQHRWSRSFTCPAGSGCANALCSGKAVIAPAYSRHYWKTDLTNMPPHGAKGGHAPNIQSYTCAP